MPLVEHDERDARSFLVFWLCRLIVKTLMRIIPATPSTLRRLAVLDQWAARNARPIRGVVVTPETIAEVRVERITPDGIEDSRIAVLYTHGGAFLAGGLDTHRPIAAAIARAVGAPVVNVAYRQCPEVGVGTSVRDGYAVYRELRRSGEFDAVVVAGDSAGGYIAAKIVEYAARDGLARPDAYVGLSPLLNLSPGADRTSRHDAMLPIKKIEKLRQFYDQGPEVLDGELNVTLDAVARLFPPAIVVCGRGEALQKDAMDLCAALDRAGVTNELHLYAGQIHAFPAAVPGSAQTRDAVARVAEFVRRAVGAGRERADIA